ncbi:virulence RhuM family protein [Muribaculum intestinale]|uniref:virulence RhuM family protein n=1 Tax=Muribaculum intestinale TaxID=1796646 RepID=UPI003F66AB4E
MNDNKNKIKNSMPEEYSSEGNEIILYQPDSTLSLDVRVENETVWLTQAQIVELFASSKANVSEHIKNIFASNELNKEATVRKFRTVRIEGGRSVNRNIEYFNLDVIISIGYRVNTKRGIQFRQWANRILKEYLLRGYSINQRLSHLEDKIDRRFSEYDRHLLQLDDKIDFFVKASLPPVEGIFFNGQIFDAYKFVCDLVKSARKRIILIDNYVDESVLTLFDKRGDSVKAVIYTDADRSRQIRLDLQRHNRQYAPIEIKYVVDIHDRFLIIDDTLYHIGASIKDLGKKLFAFSKMEISPSVILDKL